MPQKNYVLLKKKRKITPSSTTPKAAAATTTTLTKKYLISSVHKIVNSGKNEMKIKRKKKIQKMK